jgi:hypothetical protein
MNDKPMTMKDIRPYLAKQGLSIDRNWVSEYCTITRKGEFVAQGQRSEIEDRIRSGEEF